MTAKAKAPKRISINLALQGGGAQGAFTWGVLDRLSEEEAIEVEGISGTSAGALNAAAFTYGFIKGGHKGAKKELHNLWHTISEVSGALNPTQMWSPFFPNDFLGWSPVNFWMDFASQILSPYQLNPLNYCPLREVLHKTIDFEVLQNTKRKIKLFIGATNVETNRLKMFHDDEICEETLLASACLPTLFQAVKWKGHYYWDGGYMGNPVLESLIYHCVSKDIILVPINAMHHHGVPTTPKAILDRLNEITFNASLMREIRGLLRIQSLPEHLSKKNPYLNVRLHCIQNEKFMGKLDARSKYNTDWAFLLKLKKIGRASADCWIKENYQKLGKETSMDLSNWEMEEP
ncbi:MAG TPA: patatin-like phospholipase family protein [Alphaproteobacteria bacterium]|nr:patatin-like phospholipase family protein [Alphaproteobacteria bacterium]